MGMKSKSIVDKVNAKLASTLPPIPAVPSVPVAKKVVQPLEQRSERAGDDKGFSQSERMTKADWSNKDRQIEKVAIMKSVLESPLLGQRIIGLNQKDAFVEFRAWFDEAINVFYGK